MATKEEPIQTVARVRVVETPGYLTAERGIRSWLLTTDHKRICILYMFSITCFFLIGGVAALIMRLELLTPMASLVQPETYDKLFTVHGIIMVSGSFSYHRFRPRLVTF